jgi:hypothetical protein
MQIQQLTKVVPPLIQNTVGTCTQITLCILYPASSKLETVLQQIYTSTQASYVPALTMFPNH